jgi:hypothetical protein
MIVNCKPTRLIIFKAPAVEHRQTDSKGVIPKSKTVDQPSGCKSPSARGALGKPGNQRQWRCSSAAQGKGKNEKSKWTPPYVPYRKDLVPDISICLAEVDLAGSQLSLGTPIISLQVLMGLDHFFPNFFPKPIFPKSFGKVWKKSLEKVWKPE